MAECDGCHSCVTDTSTETAGQGLMSNQQKSCRLIFELENYTNGKVIFNIDDKHDFWKPWIQCHYALVQEIDVNKRKATSCALHSCD